MKKRIFSLAMLALVGVFTLYGNAFGGGGPEGAGCTDLPEPKRGPFLQGNFTVALDEITAITIPELAHYNIHLVLEGKGETHLFSTAASLGAVGVCDVSDEWVEVNFNDIPCKLGVGDAFGLEGTPVIYKVKIKERDFCDDPLKAMISGKIVIRVVPPPRGSHHLGDGER